MTEEVGDEHGSVVQCWPLLAVRGLRLAQELALTRVTAFDGGDAAQHRQWQKPAVRTGNGFVRMLYAPRRGHNVRPTQDLSCQFVVRSVARNLNRGSQESKRTHGFGIQQDRPVTECPSLRTYRNTDRRTPAPRHLRSERGGCLRSPWRLIATTPVYDQHVRAELNEVTLVQCCNEYIEVLREQREQGIVGDVAGRDD